MDLMLSGMNFLAEVNSTLSTSLSLAMLKTSDKKRLASFEL